MRETAPLSTVGGGLLDRTAGLPVYIHVYKCGGWSEPARYNHGETQKEKNKIKKERIPTDYSRDP